jgi:flagellar hook-length control protein FliK
MALHPAELGGVEIHLRHTQAGLVAHVVADHTAAAHVLREAGAELRRSLEAQGIDLLRLDIGTAQGDDRRSLGNEGTAGGGAGRSNHRAAPDAVAAEEQVTETSIRLPSGALIDVLA